MNTFGEIISVGRFKKVTYYSVAVNGGASLYKEFLMKHSLENKEKLYHILAWLKEIGDTVGAHEQYFRNEAKTGDARALPPKGKNREPHYVEFTNEDEKGEVRPNNLRLYCMRANEHVVFLFHGDIKTAQNPEDCDNVRAHFKLANQLSKLIDKAFRDQEIRWIHNHMDIEVDEDFILEWN